MSGAPCVYSEQDAADHGGVMGSHDRASWSEKSPVAGNKGARSGSHFAAPSISAASGRWRLRVIARTAAAGAPARSPSLPRLRAHRSKATMQDRNLIIEAELPSLRRYARALAADADRANDLVQDCVTSALAHWGQYRGDGPVRAWLFTIMRNAFFRSVRRDARWTMVSIDEAAEPAAPAQVDPLYLREVGAALAALSLEQREVLALVAVEGLTYAEAAAVTDTPIGTVMSRLGRARAKLRELMGEDGADRARPGGGTRIET